MGDQFANSANGLAMKKLGSGFTSGSEITLLGIELNNLINKYSCKPLDIFSNAI